VVYWW